MQCVTKLQKAWPQDFVGAGGFNRFVEDLDKPVEVWSVK